MSKKSKLCEAFVLVTFIGVTWMLLLIPIIIFHLPDSIYVEQTDDEIGESTECLSAISYPTQGGTCQDMLEDISTMCDTERSPLMVLRNDEATARLLIPALRLLSPSSECVSAAVPLLCLHLFGLCDSSGVSVHPTSGQCRNVRDSLCSAEWKFAFMSGFELPDCEIFPKEQESCPGLDGNITSLGNQRPTLNSSALEIFPCQENFFRPEGSAICIASCYTWSARSVTISTDVVIALSAIIGFITGLSVLVISLLRYKQIFSFPSVFIVYMNLDVIVITFFIVVSYFDRPSLYCTSENLQTSIRRSTPFCVIAGILFNYIILQLGFWWLFHTSALLWKIGFPLHARSFEMSGKTKYVHIFCALVGIIVPLTPVIALMAAYGQEVQTRDELIASNITFLSGGLGFAMFSFPPVLCSGNNVNEAYYSTALPLNVIFFVGIAELILLFGIVHKQHGLFTSKQSITTRFKISTAERKVLIALCFYVLLLIFNIPTLTLATRFGSLLQKQLRKYFICEAGGVDPDHPGLCDESRDAYRKLIYPELIATSFVLFNLFPVILLVYTVNFEELKEKWKNLCSKRKSVSQNEMQATRASL